jgi:AbrB family looped-hinge helix DNA binding protein
MPHRADRHISVSVGRQGRIVIPARVRAELGVTEGDRLDLRVTRGRIELVPERAKVERLRGVFADLAPNGGVVDELLAERREEARREDAG